MAPSPRNMAIRPEFSIILWTCAVDNVVSTMTCSVSRFTVNDLIPLPKKEPLSAVHNTKLFVFRLSAD